jgi:hypothetical protein
MAGSARGGAKHTELKLTTEIGVEKVATKLAPKTKPPEKKFGQKTSTKGTAPARKSVQGGKSGLLGGKRRKAASTSLALIEAANSSKTPPVPTLFVHGTQDEKVAYVPLFR